MKSKNCSHEVQEKNEYCGICSAKVVFESEISTMKNCPSCKDLQNPDVLSCTNCQINLKTCKEKKEDGSSCEAFIAYKCIKEIQNFCTGCGKPVQKDELDGRTQTQVTQPLVIARHTGSPKEKKTEPGDVGGSPKDKEEIDSSKSGGEDPTKKCATRGLAVICTHCSYSTTFKLKKRNVAEIDDSLMVDAWKSYGCEILRFKEKTNAFYQKELISEIEEKLKDMKSIDYFVFVLSTHGDESLEGLVNTDGDKSREGLVNTDGDKSREGLVNTDGDKSREGLVNTDGDKSREGLVNTDGDKILEGLVNTDGEKSGEVNIEEKKKPLFHEYVHYFYSEDGRYKTQVLIDAIGKIKGLEKKLKMFFIQACRGRFNTENQDHGHDIAVVERIINPRDAVGNMPAEDDKIKPPKPKTEGVDKEDALGLAPKQEEGKCTEPDNFEEIPIAIAELHCNDSVVAFASMSGKDAYHKLYSEDQGSWLIRALHTTMIEHNKLEDTVHILDILTGVNMEVSLMKACIEGNFLKAQSCFLHNLTFSDEQLQFKYQYPVDKHEP